MIKEEFGFGNSIEEATEQAVKNLNCGDADYKIEIIDDYKPKVLGMFGGHPAKVRAYFECPDEPKQKKEKPSNKTKKTSAKPQKKVSKPETKDSEKENTEDTNQLNYVELKDLSDGSPAKGAAMYLLEVLEKLGVTDISLKVAEIENGSQISIDGKNLGVIIGRRGETLDALQYLASFAANSNKSSGYYRIVLNTGNYREKRADTLKALARRMSSQAIKLGRPRSLEPMNPYERRIIHTEVQGIDGVSSHSVGDGTRRHVVICPDGVTPRNSRGNRNRGERKSAPAVESPKREPRSDSESDIPLYGRIG